MTETDAAELTTRPDAEVRSRRLAGMEGLRGLAALSIVVYHCWLYAVQDGSVGNRALDAGLRHLSAGVLLFFTLSGLLLYRPFVEAIVGDRPFPSMRRYARNRFFRIMPAYWVILLVVGLVLGAALVPGGETFISIGFLTDPDLMVSNLLLLQNYRPSSFLTGIGPAWTLAVEVAYYAALPVVSFAVFGVARRISSARRAGVAFLPPAVFLLVGFVGKAVASRAVGDGDGWDRTWGGVLSRSFLANADLFAFGMVVAVVTVLHTGGRLQLPRFWRPVTALLVVGCAGLAVMIPGGALGEPRYDVLAALASALLVALLVVGASADTIALRFLERRALVGAGLISYSLYLWHEPLIHLLVDREVLGRPGLVGFLLAVAIVSVVAVSLATLTYLAVERPALRRKARPGPGLRAGHR